MKSRRLSTSLAAVVVSYVLVIGCSNGRISDTNTQKLVAGFSDSVCKIVAENSLAINLIPTVKIKVEFQLEKLFKELSKFGITGQYTWIDTILGAVQREPENCRDVTYETITKLVANKKNGYQRDHRREKARSELVQQMQSAVVNMADSHVGSYLSRTIPKIDGGVGCDELSEMLKESSASHRRDTIKDVAPYIHRPFSRNCFADLSDLVPQSHASEAIEILQNSSPKY